MYLPDTDGSVYSPKEMYKDIHDSSFHNGIQLQIIQMSIPSKMDNSINLCSENTAYSVYY